MSAVEVGIITVKQEELEALLARIGSYREIAPDPGEGRFYYRARVEGTDGHYHEVVCAKALQQGNVSAVSVVRDLVERWRPKLVLLVGIGGGLGSEVEIGDVVVASQILYYELGKVTETGTIRRIEAYRPSARGLMAAETVQEHSWVEQTRDSRPLSIARDPKRHVAPLGSGEKVIADASADEAAFLRSVSYKVAALDMEAAGIASAAYEHASGVEFLVIRGISDRANRDKDDSYQVYAARSASAFVVALLGKLSAYSAAPDRRKDALTILAACPEGLPLQLLAASLGVAEGALLPALQDLAAKGDVHFDESASWVRSLEAPRNETDPTRPDLLVLALEEGLAFVSRHKTGSAVFRLLPSLCALARTLTSRYPRICCRVFKGIEKPLKTLGDKHEILEVARLSIEATGRVNQRTREEVELKAHAIICGVSWVYQRTGRLKEAMAEAENSLDLGKEVHYDRNTAFCQKCIGRLYRLLAESSSGTRRREFLTKSARSIEAAITGFSRHPDFGPDHAEVGACHSLAARTLLVQGDLRGARRAADAAWALITDQSDKDYLDLLIVAGELEFAGGDRSKALAYLDAAIKGSDPPDGERSEILARAHLARARCRSQMGMTAQALSDCEIARQISHRLNEPEETARARWLAASIGGTLTTDIERALGDEPYGVRIRVLDAIRAEEATPRSTIARRSKRTTAQWQRLIRQARERLAIEEPPW